MQHSRTKHTEIRHHFLRHHFLSDHAQKGDITLKFVSTKDQLVDIFTKPLSEEQFVDIRRQLGVISLWSNVCSKNSWWICLLIAWISCYMHHIEIYLDNGQIWTKIQNSLGIGHKKLRISTKNGRRGSQIEKVHKILKSQNIDRVDQAVDQPGPIDRFVRIGVLKRLSHFMFSPVSSGSSRVLPIQLSNSDLWGHCNILKALDWIFGKFGG